MTKERSSPCHTIFCAHSQVMEPGWSPLPTDPQPYFQVDFLEPMWVSGVVTQGTERMWGSLTKYRLAFALHSSLFTDFTENGKPDGPAKVYLTHLNSTINYNFSTVKHDYIFLYVIKCPLCCCAGV